LVNIKTINRGLSGSRSVRPVWVAVAAVLICACAVPLAFGQSISPDLLRSISPEMLRALQQGQIDGGYNGDTGAVKPEALSYPPTALSQDQSPPSRLEQIYLRRSGEFLKQFGYDVLGQPATVTINQSGAVLDKYVLATNDELVVTLRGQENSTYRVRVDRNGNVTLPKLNPILASGRRFGDFRADLEAQVAQAYLSTRVFVTPGNIHQMSILVSGEVRSPGARIVSGLASPLDVILLSGGIKKTGSLRSVRVSGAGGSRIVDLYSVIAQGGPSGLGVLRDGDTVYVPPVNATAAVAGAVTRPGIFELPSGNAGASAAALLRLAGGAEIGGSYRLAKISVLGNGTLSLAPTTSGALVRNGEVLVVLAEHGPTAGRVSVRGAVAGAGVYPLTASGTASELFHSGSDLSFDGYGPLALILRRDPVTNAVTIVPFSIAGAIRKTYNVPLRGEDLIYVLTRAEASSLASLVTKNVNNAYSPAGATSAPQTPGENGLTAPSPGVTQVQTAPSPFYAQRPPAAGHELPPGIEPPPNTATPNTAAGAESPAPYSPSGAYQSANGAIPYASSNSGTNQQNVDPNDPRFRFNDRADSAEAAALAQARTLVDRDNRLNRSGLRPVISDQEVVDELARLLHVTSDALLRTASDNLVWVLDEVRDPGPYLGAPGSSVADMIQAAGGVQQTADLSSIEVTSTAVDQRTGITRTNRSQYSGGEIQTAAVAIQPLDVIRLRPVYSDRDEGTVTVAGQVRYPGSFDIRRDEHLSALLKRAGGLSEVAYPYGAIFTRRDAAITEREGNERSARELENEAPTLIMSQGTQSQDLASASTYLASLARSLRQAPALGRIVITADPAVLAVKPDLDFVLQPGDTLFVPKRPSTVTVSGEVLNPGAFQYRRGLPFSDYVKMAGGATQSADDDRTFVVFPDGSSAPIDSGWLSFGSNGDIPPGSTIVVPRDLRPFNWSQFLKDVTQIASQLAVTAASLSVLNNN
jgi:polysaccharide export outer membrane protein